MAHARTFRFGLQAAVPPAGMTWTAFARNVEDIGFSTLFVPDHFGDQLAPGPAMTAAAAATTSLRVGTLVADNDYKHPVVHAKELATIDVLSEGRLEIGLGAGWMRSDYEQSGIPYDKPGTRIERFEEGLAIIKGLFAPGPFSFDGAHYTIQKLDGLPKPIQQPAPPIIIGAGGPRMLAIAARHADIVGVNPSMRSGQIDASTAADATAEAYDRKLEAVRASAGDRFDDLELSCLLFLVAATDDRPGYAASIAPMFDISTEAALDVPIALFGTVDEMCELLQQRRERWGISYIVVQLEALDAIAPVVARLTGT